MPIYPILVTVMTLVSWAAPAKLRACRSAVSRSRCGIDRIGRGRDAVRNMRRDDLDGGVSEHCVDGGGAAAHIRRVEVDLGRDDPRAVLGPPDAGRLVPEVVLTH